VVAPADVDGIGDHGQAGCAHPDVELGVEELLALAREQALLDRGEHAVVDPSGQAADEEGERVAERAGGVDQPDAADAAAEEDVVHPPGSGARINYS